MDALLRSVRLAFRRLAKSPSFTATAVLTLALCFAANLTILAVVDAVLVRPLPFPGGDRLVNVVNGYPGAGVDRAGASIPNYFDRRHAIKAFASISIFRDDQITVGGVGAPQRVEIGRVSPEFFATLGVPLVMGKAFNDENLTYQTDMVAVITDGFWRSFFAADPNVIGRTFLNDGLTITVVGVLPPGFSFLSSRAQFFRPASHELDDRKPEHRHDNSYEMIARLAPGVTLADAQAQMDAFNVQQAHDDPLIDLVKSARYHTSILPLRADHVRNIKPMLVLLQAGVVCLLAIGCVNLINLLLIRATTRTRELAVRQALGASRQHIVYDVLVETIILGLVAGIAGLALGTAGIALIRQLGIDHLPLGTSVEFDGRLGLAALGGSVLIGVILAVPVIWLNLRSNVAPVLQTESRGGTVTRGTQRLRHGFVVAQVALAFVLLAGSGLLELSLHRVLSAAPGFSPENVLTGRIALPWKDYRDEAARVAFANRLLPAIRSLPGVTAAAISSGLPFDRNFNDSVVTVEGFVPKPGETIRAHFNSEVSAEYWSTMGIPVVHGRVFDEGDVHTKPRVCVIDTALADRYWPGENPVGRRLVRDVKFSDKDALTVVGVVGEVKQRDLAEAGGHGALYLPYGQYAPSDFALVVRSTLSTAALAPMIQKAVRQLDPGLPVDNLRPMQAQIDNSLIARRSPAILAGIFAVVALLLAGIGTYGVLSYGVAQRRREIGVRMAIGALPGQIRNQFVSLGLRVLVFGTVFGVAGAWWVGRAMQSMLYDVPPLPLPTIAAVTGIVGALTLAACIIPACRAARTDPLTALRSE